LTGEPSYRNALLRALSGKDLSLLRGHLVAEELHVDRLLESSGSPVQRAYFIETGFASACVQGAGHEVEAYMIGAEGMTGTSLLLGQPSGSHQCRVRVAGEAFCIASQHLRAALAASDSLRSCLLHYVHTLTAQTALTVLSSACATVEVRLARWLLMAQDRKAGEEIAVTHDILAGAIGARRASITGALHLLEEKQLLRSTRGLVTLKDRVGLEALCGAMYRPISPTESCA
jgi:CRP-like cAMP-binding protein